MTFKYVSLFSGIGGFEQALNKLGGTCVLASEIDKFANQAYEVLYGKPTVGDITKVHEKDVPDHDLLTMGFPCQAFSVAGKRGGFEDARGTLFFEGARIAAEKQPKMILAENVKGLVGHDKGKTLDTIVMTLNQIGYHVDFNVLNSKYFGVPQNRERIFIVAIRDDLVVSEPWIIEGSNVVAKGKRRISEYEDVKAFNFDWPEQAEVTTRLRDILETDVDERYYLSEEKTAKLVAQLEEIVIDEMDKQREISEKEIDPYETDVLDIYKDKHGTLYYFDGHRDDGLWTMVKVEDSEVIKHFDPNDLAKVSRYAKPQMLGHIDLKGHDAIRRVYSAEGVSPTLTTMGGGHREPKIAEVANGNNLLYCIDANYTKGIAPSGIGKGRRTHIGEISTSQEHGIAIREATQKGYAVACEGDAVNIQFPGSTTRRGRVGKQIAQTIEASGVNQGVVTPRYRIRKLTPLECFRLQGFPDSAHQALVNAGISNSQRYKMAGNAVTVNVIEAIGERLLPYLERPYNAPSVPADSSANSKACAPSTV